MKCFAVTLSLTALSASLLALAGCSGSSAPVTSPLPTAQSFGPLTTRIVGAAQAPVTSSRALGANVTGIAGALVDQLTLNFQGPRALSETKIAFTSTRDAGNYDVYSMNSDGTSQTRLTTNAAFDLSPSWSPDGSKVVFESYRDGNYEIYLMNADGTNQINLSNNPAGDSFPSWSPDGSKIAFSSSRSGNEQIYLMNADGSNPVQLTNNANSDSSPTWSPDGTKIAFYSSRDGNSEIYSMNANGTVQKRLTINTTADLYPSWSPSGDKIAFVSYRDGYSQIYSMNADGTNQIKLSNTLSTDLSPSWSPDGNRVVFHRDSDIYWMSSSGGSATNITNNGLFNSKPSWSGYLPRTPKTLIGTGGALGTVAAGFLFGQNGDTVTTVLAFDTTVTTLSARAAARVVAQTAAETEGNNLIFNITTTVGLASVSYAPLNEAGVPGTAVSLTIPAGSTNALVSFNATTGTVSSVIPYAANRSASARPVRSGDNLTYSGSFKAIFDASGKNLAPGGAKSVTLDEKTGTLVRFE